MLRGRAPSEVGGDEQHPGREESTRGGGETGLNAAVPDDGEGEDEREVHAQLPAGRDDDAGVLQLVSTEDVLAAI